MFKFFKSMEDLMENLASKIFPGDCDENGNARRNPSRKEYDPFYMLGILKGGKPGEGFFPFCRPKRKNTNEDNANISQRDQVETP